MLAPSTCLGTVAKKKLFCIVQSSIAVGSYGAVSCPNKWMFHSVTLKNQIEGPITVYVGSKYNVSVGGISNTHVFESHKISQVRRLCTPFSKGHAGL